MWTVLHSALHSYYKAIRIWDENVLNLHRKTMKKSEYSL